jgi:Glycosyl hydrolase family 92 catalytic domain
MRRHRDRVGLPRPGNTLFHVLCGRSVVGDADGRYLDNTWGHGVVKQIPLDSRGQPKFGMYNYDALWLTQWNVNSILGLAYAEVYSSFVQSQLQMYKDGGLLPRGPVGGDDSFIMTSSPVTSFIAAAWHKGIHDFDVDLAYEAMLDAQSVGGLFDKGWNEYSTWTDAGGSRAYLNLGYVPNGSQGAGKTLEYAFQDWTLAQLARSLHKTGINATQYADVAVSSQRNGSNYAGARAIDGRPIRSSISPQENVEWQSAGSRTRGSSCPGTSPERCAPLCSAIAPTRAATSTPAGWSSATAARSRSTAFRSTVPRRWCSSRRARSARCGSP